MVKDEKGDVVRVFIDGYITTDEDVKNLKKGCKITVTGLASYDDTFNAPEGPFPRIRIRDRADVVCTAAAPQTGDNFHMGLWLSLMALTAAGVVVLFSRKRKEQI
jgi:LPXTG-motif cell wall-anchored protein